METSLSCLPRSALEPTLERSPNIKSRLTAAIEREVAFLKETDERAGRPKPLERIAALFVTLARCNAYEGRDPSVLTDSLSCGVVAGYLDMSLDDLAHWLTELEAPQPRRGGAERPAPQESRRAGAPCRRRGLSERPRYSRGDRIGRQRIPP